MKQGFCMSLTENQECHCFFDIMQEILLMSRRCVQPLQSWKFLEAIPFLTRLGSNLKLHKQLVSEHVDDLAKSKYMLMQRDHLHSVKRVEVSLFGYIGYAYVVIDHVRREDEIFKYAKSALDSKDVSHDEMDTAIKTKGLFILVSSEKIETNDVMPLYYTRQTVERVFDVSKNNADLLPLRVHNEETFRGHLLLCFIITVAYISINQILKDTAFNPYQANEEKKIKN